MQNNLTGARADKIIFLDTETTGLNYDGTDEIVEIAIVDGCNNILLHSYVKPDNHSQWPEAEAIHHITPDMVKDAPSISDLQPLINEIFDNAEHVIIYNSDYDMKFLNPVLDKDHDDKLHCCMKDFAEFYGEWNEQRGSFKFKSLSFSMDYYSQEWRGDAHGALADTFACKAVWEQIHPDFSQPVIAAAKTRGR